MRPTREDTVTIGPAGRMAALRAGPCADIVRQSRGSGLFIGGPVPSSARIGGVTGASTVLAGNDRSPLHVCLVTETFPPEVNGVAMTLARLVEGLRARGQEVRVVRPRRPRPELDVAGGDDTLVRGARIPGCRGVRIGWPACRSLRARWSARRPDAVYVATPGPLGWAAVRTACRLGIPVLSGFHTDFPGYARHYALGGIAAAVRGYLRRLHNRTQRTVVPSVDLLARLHDQGFRNLALLGRGVDTRVFRPARRDPALRASWGVRDDRPVPLYVGRLAPEKNVALAIEAARAMQRAGPTGPLVVVGDGPLREPLAAAHPDVHFCGVQRDVPLATHYASADVFLFPSETETFGNVVLEAMASALAIVAFDYAAAGTHLRGGAAGVLAPLGDHRGFVSAVAALARDPLSVARLRRAAWARAVLLDWEPIVDRFEALLAGAADGRPAPRRGEAPWDMGRAGVGARDMTTPSPPGGAW